ncbi:MAG: Gfo/Idh/MocA family oxidoreductase [Caldilineaceae bacterium]|nr:Gfo/Idh/MocA family oxidoreductase [Caldilineaceae bacterium]
MAGTVAWTDVTSPIGIGVVGCGVIGTQHVRVASALPCASPRAVLDLERDRAEALAVAHGVPRVCANLEEMLALSEVEAVVMAVPAAFRMPMSRRVLAAGCHLLLEKPVAMNAGEVRLLEAWRDRDQVVACCAARFRCLESFAPVHEVLAAGKLGTPQGAVFRALTPAPPRPNILPPAWRLQSRLNGGGVLMNWGCYDLDYLLGMWPEPLVPRTVRARMWGLGPDYRNFVVPDSDGETHVVAWIECADGFQISYERGEYHPGPRRAEFQVFGDRGSLDLTMVPNRDRADILWCSDDAAGSVSETVQCHPDRAADLHSGVVEDFCRAVRSGCEPAAGLDFSFRVQATLDAMYRSARTGCPVEVESDL